MAFIPYNPNFDSPATSDYDVGLSEFYDFPVAAQSTVPIDNSNFFTSFLSDLGLGDKLASAGKDIFGNILQSQLGKANQHFLPPEKIVRNTHPVPAPVNSESLGGLNVKTGAAVAGGLAAVGLLALALR